MQELEKIDYRTGSAISMGEGASRVFRGEGSDAVEAAYGDSYRFFRKLLLGFLKDPFPSEPYKIGDWGAHKGDLWVKIVNDSPLANFKIHLTALDVNKEALDSNTSANYRMCGDASATELPDRCFNAIVVRYLLQFNNWEKQKKILTECHRVLADNGIAIIEHAAAPSLGTNEWRDQVQSIFNDPNLPGLKRPEIQYSSWGEIKEFLDASGIRYHLEGETVVFGISKILAERYGLSQGKTEYLKNVLKGSDWYIRTRFVILGGKKTEELSRNLELKQTECKRDNVIALLEAGDKVRIPVNGNSIKLSNLIHVVRHLGSLRSCDLAEEQRLIYWEVCDLAENIYTSKISDHEIEQIINDYNAYLLQSGMALPSKSFESDR